MRRYGIIRQLRFARTQPIQLGSVALGNGVVLISSPTEINNEYKAKRNKMWKVWIQISFNRADFAVFSLSRRRCKWLCDVSSSSILVWVSLSWKTDKTFFQISNVDFVVLLFTITTIPLNFVGQHTTFISDTVPIKTIPCKICNMIQVKTEMRTSAFKQLFIYSTSHRNW